MTAALLALLAASAPGLVNARTATGSAAAGLDRAVADALRAGPSPRWIAYTVPIVSRGRRICCWDGSSVGDRCCGSCRLERDNGFSTGRRETPVPLEVASTGLVLLRGEGGRVARVRFFSSDCTVDAGGLPVLLLGDVDPAQSVRLLAGYAESGEGERRHDGIGDGALAAVAHHAGPPADDVLERLVRPDRPDWLRKQAAFWLGQARGERGYQVLARMMREDASPDVRSHVTFALSQSDVPQALPELIRAARGDQSSQVRGQALFWLAQKAGDKAAREITRAIDDDPDTDVKEKAVFALSQLPRDQGVPLLIDVARNNHNREVRKKAMFWLGQSNDDRALAFIEDVLRR